MRTIRFALWILGLALLLIPSALPAQQLAGAAPPAIPPPDERFTLPHLPALQNPALPAASQTAAWAPFMNWSSAVYQDVAAGNWEVMIVTAGTTVRLTTNDVPDTEPRLNHSATQIVFTSMRAGYHHIFTMNVDGTGLTQLTSGSTHNESPAWSPDSSKIAFVSKRDGQEEIYVMDANGANPRRLTWNPGADIQPTWSPDGTKIAFSSNRSGYYHIWLMQADGTQMQELFTNLLYCIYPAWSPDGQYLAFSSVYNGWLQVWNGPINGSNPWKVYSAQADQSSRMADAWVSGWSPDGKSIVATVIDLIYYQGQWYWTKSTVLGIRAQYDYDHLHGGPTGWLTNYQSLDRSAPALRFHNLPEYHRAGNFRVAWDIISDAGGSELLQFELQSRVDNSAWSSTFLIRDPFDPPLPTHVDVTGRLGTTMEFRLRGSDEALNQSNWFDADRQVRVTFFDQQISGTVLDSRGMPRRGASIAGAPQLLGAGDSDPSGNYTRYTATTGSHTITVSQTGYSALPPTSVTPVTATALAHVLPPRQDFVQNGHFESDPAPTWNVSGEVALTTRAAGAHSGRHGLQLGWESGGISRIAQTITLPPDIHAPTLSFVYRYQSEIPMPPDAFSLVAQDTEGHATPLLATNANTFSPTLTDGWAHAWFDMDAWRGETITLTFALTNTMQEAPTWVILDEVTLGAWESPSITAIAPTRIEAQSTAAITITGANFIPTPTVTFGATPATSVQWLDEHSLRVTPPASLTPGLHHVSVSNPGGATATLLNGLQVGYRVLLPVAWKALRLW